MTALRIVLSFLAGILGIILIVVGAVTAVTPVPLGIPLVFIGIAMLAGGAPDMLRWIRKRWGWLNRKLKRLENRLPKWLARSLRQSDPEPEEERVQEAEVSNNSSTRAAMARDLLSKR